MIKLDRYTRSHGNRRLSNNLASVLLFIKAVIQKEKKSKLVH